MGMDSKSKIKLESGMAGMIWFIGWLFSIGFLNLSFGKGFLAILLWPYYLGDYFSTVEKMIN
jgi:hypothetical protein